MPHTTVPDAALLALAHLYEIEELRTTHPVDKLKPPSPEQETWAVDRLESIGYKEHLMRAMRDFYVLAHSPTPEGAALLQLRVLARHPKRRRAMGVACIAIDVLLGLLNTLGQYSEVTFKTMAEEFRCVVGSTMRTRPCTRPSLYARVLVLVPRKHSMRRRKHPDADQYPWTDEALLRVLFRRGMMERYWPEAERLWPTCFYGMLTAALAFTGRLLSRQQRRALALAFNRAARLGCAFARRIIIGDVYGEGQIYWIDSTQPDAPPVTFSRASLDGFDFDQGPNGSDLASRLVQIFMGEVRGIKAHPLFVPGVHSRLYCLGVVRSWLLDTARDGTPAQ